MSNYIQHRSTSFLALLPMTIALFISGCAGIINPITTTDYSIGIPDFAIVKSKGVYRGGQPNSVGWDFLKNDLQIITVVKLNPEAPDNSDKTALKLGMELIPKNETVRSHGMSPDGLLDAWATPQKIIIDEAMKALMDENKWPIYVHCSHGWDRTGLIIAMFRVCHDHYSKAEATDEMNKHGFNIGHKILFLGGLSSYWDKFDSENCNDWPLIPKE